MSALHWLATHIGLLAGLATVGSLVVWMFYARLLYVGFRRHEQPMILIHQANAYSERSCCLVVNLSREAIHVLGIHAVLHHNGRRTLVRITEYDRVADSRAAGGQTGETLIKEGPLKPGDFLALGSLHELLCQEIGQLEEELQGRVSRPGGAGLSNGLRAEIRVIAHYSAYEEPVAASRFYTLKSVEQRTLFTPETLLTRQLVKKRERRQARRWLEEVTRLG